MLITLPNAFGDAYTNMAIDAALLEALPAESVVFRHYGWTAPAITFGYGQKYTEVENHAPGGLTLCRRMTGGGIVDHRNDWTYALVIDSRSRPAAIPSTELYAILHAAIAKALSFLKVATRLAPCPRKCDEVSLKPSGPDQCFIQPAMNDVLLPSGQKVAGAAMKRTRKGLLVQGSIDRSSLPAELDYLKFTESFIAELASALELTRQNPDDLRALFPGEVIAREKAKFASPEWTARR